VNAPVRDPLAFRPGIACGLVHAVFLLTCASAQAPAVRLNEVLYDPAGSDAGYEFVELFNASDAAVDLAGWRLEAGNGARAGDWHAQWEGAQGERIGPRALFLIAGALVAARADARVDLALQNGPDAVRLLSPRGEIDLLGWGALEFEEYFEGRPAEDVAGGVSLARIPDGRDTDDNAADFHARSRPTPGAENAPERMIALGDAHCDPPLLDPGGTVELVVPIVNLGQAAVDPGALVWNFAGDGLTGRLLDPPDRLEPEAACDLAWEVTADASAAGARRAVPVAISLDEGENGSSISCVVNLGRGDVLISEIQYDPPEGEGEWIELVNASDHDVSLAGWRVRDSSGRATRIVNARKMRPGGYAIVAEDPQALLRAHAELSADAIAARQDAWPALNNSVDRQTGYADEIVVLDSTQAVSDYVRYAPGELDGGGVSLERWIEGGVLVDPRALVPCPAASGSTPGFSSRPVGGSGGVAPEPAPAPHPFEPWEPGSEKLCLIPIPDLGAGGEEVTAEIFTLAGLRVATLSAGARVAGPLVLAWNGRSSAGDALPSGLYIVKASVRSRASTAHATHVVPLALQGPR